MLSGDEKTGPSDPAQLYQRHHRLSAVGRGDIHPRQQSHADVWAEWQPFGQNLFGVLAHLQAQEGVNFEIRPRRGLRLAEGLLPPDQSNATRLVATRGVRTVSCYHSRDCLNDLWIACDKATKSPGGREASAGATTTSGYRTPLPVTGRGTCSSSAFMCAALRRVLTESSGCVSTSIVVCRRS